MSKIAFAAAAIGGVILMGGVSARVATAAGPIGIHAAIDQASLVQKVRRGGGGFRGGGFRGGGFRGGGFRGGGFRGGRWAGRGYRGGRWAGRGRWQGGRWAGRGRWHCGGGHCGGGWRRGWVWRNGLWVAPLAYGAYYYGGGSCESVCGNRWGWGGPNFRQCLVNRGC